MNLPTPVRALGWVKDPYDQRDQDAVPLLASRSMAVPASADNRDLVKIVDQGILGSCTANAVGQAIRAAELVQQVETAAANGVDALVALYEAQKNTEFMSRLFAYFLARAWEGLTKIDSGTFIRLIFTSVNKYGFPPESAWPYSDNIDPDNGPFTKMPSAEAFRMAYDQRDNVANRQAGLISYSRISAMGQARIDAIKLALSQRYLIAFGTLVTNKFCSDMSANGGKPIDPPTNPNGSDIAGGHAMCMGGYDNNGVKIINSWSEQFGDRGWCTFTWDYITWGYTTDLWIVKRAPLLQKAA